MKCYLCQEDKCRRVEGEEEEAFRRSPLPPLEYHCFRFTPDPYHLYECDICGPYGIRKVSEDYLTHFFTPLQRELVTLCVRRQSRPPWKYFMIEWYWLKQIRESRPPSLKLTKPPKPPWHQCLKDWNLKAAKLLLKGIWGLGRIGSAIGGWKALGDILQSFFGRQRQPGHWPSLRPHGSV